MHKFLSKAKTYRYPPPASAAQPRIPEGPAHRTYDITYYGRDTRRNEWEFTEEIENAFHPTTRNLIASHGLVEDASEKPGSAGNSVRFRRFSQRCIHIWTQFCLCYLRRAVCFWCTDVNGMGGRGDRRTRMLCDTTQAVSARV